MSQSLNPSDLLEMAANQYNLLRRAAAEITRLREALLGANTSALIYEETIDSLASDERAKLQQEMALLRARNVRLQGEIWLLKNPPAPESALTAEDLSKKLGIS